MSTKKTFILVMVALSIGLAVGAGGAARFIIERPTRAVAQDRPEGARFLAGEQSLKFHMAINPDERRGEAPHTTPMEVKKQCWKLLEQLRHDGIGLKPNTEHNIESYFTVADAFEADGLLVQAVDYLSDLRHKLDDLVAARSRTAKVDGVIQSDEDILHFRDAHNIHQFDSKYMAGAQPTEKGYRWLKSKGVTTIINLREPSEHEKQLVESLGMTYVHIPWPDEQPPSLQQVQQMLDAVKSSKGSVFQHCLRGIGRDMTMASCYMVATHGKSAEDLIREGRREVPRWETDQKRDPKSGEGVQFQLLREFEKEWKKDKR